MKNIIIDTHTHYAHKRFDCGRDEILKSLDNENIKAVIEGAIEFESNYEMKKLCKKYAFVYMAAGCHPNCVAEMNEEKFQKIIEMLDYEKVLAIGETGLDYSKNKTIEQIELQKVWFARFIELSLLTKMPLLIHAREAYDDLIDILSNYQLPAMPGVIHCFSGNVEQAQKLIDMGFYLGVTAKFTNAEEDSDIRQAIKYIPLERILLETDAPFLVPKGVEGNRNTSLNLKYVVKELAKLRNQDEDMICEVVLENTKKVYPEVFIGILKF